MIGTIAIEGIEVYAYHGVYAAERKYGNRFLVDVYLRAPILQAGEVDHLNQTVNYQSVYQRVLEIMDNPVDLLETLVVRIGREILAQFEPVQSAKVRVTKLGPMSMEQCKQTFVEAEFHR